MCCLSPLNTQVLFYDDHDSHFDDRLLDIIRINHIQYFIIMEGDSVNDHTNNNGPKLKLNNYYGNKRMYWKRKHGALKFTPAHMNGIIVETLEAFKL